jgi:hypothetical protein
MPASSSITARAVANGSSPSRAIAACSALTLRAVPADTEQFALLRAKGSLIVPRPYRREVPRRRHWHGNHAAKMKFKDERPLATPEAAERRLLDRRIFVQ